MGKNRQNKTNLSGALGGVDKVLLGTVQSGVLEGQSGVLHLTGELEQALGVLPGVADLAHVVRRELRVLDELVEGVTEVAVLTVDLAKKNQVNWSVFKIK